MAELERTAIGGEDDNGSRAQLLALIEKLRKTKAEAFELARAALDERNEAREKVVKQTEIYAEQRKAVANKVRNALRNQLDREKAEAIGAARIEYERKTKELGSQFDKEYETKNKEFEEKKKEFLKQLQDSIDKNRKELEAKEMTYEKELDKKYQIKYKELEKEQKIVNQQKQEYQLALKGAECPQCPHRQQEVKSAREECEKTVKALQDEIKANSDLIKIMQEKISQLHGISPSHRDNKTPLASCMKCATPLIRSSIPCQFPTTKAAVCFKCFKEQYPDLQPLLIGM